MATKQKSNNSGTKTDKGHSKPALTSAEQDAIRRAKKARTKSSGSVSGVAAIQRDTRVGSFKEVLKREYEERQLRKDLAAVASQHPCVLELRQNVTEMRMHLASAQGARRGQIEREINRVNQQIAEIDAALIKFGEKSNLQGLRKDAILAIRMSNGYLRRIIRDALFGALRQYMDATRPVTDAEAS